MRIIISSVLLYSGATIMAKEVEKPKPFGTGVGPTFIGGRDSDSDGTKIALEVYRQFRQYKRIVDKVDEDYYSR